MAIWAIWVQKPPSHRNCKEQEQEALRATLITRRERCATGTGTRPPSLDETREKRPCWGFKFPAINLTWCMCVCCVWWHIILRAVKCHMQDQTDTVPLPPSS